MGMMIVTIRPSGGRGCVPSCATTLQRRRQACKWLMASSMGQSYCAVGGLGADVS